jgi:hypothetical protein
MKTTRTPAKTTFACETCPNRKTLSPTQTPGWRGYGAGTQAGAPAGKHIKPTWLHKGLPVTSHEAVIVE